MSTVMDAEAASPNKAVNADAQGRQRAARAPVLGRGLRLR
jgi:hypothetical protein